MPSRGQQLGKLLNSSGDIVETSLPPKIETFSQSVSNTGKIEASALGDDVSTIEQVSDVSLLTASGNSVGDQRVVGNNLYIWNGVGWYRIALINQTPTWDSGGQPAGAYVLDADSPQDATIITLAASDPDGLPISYSYVTAGSMDSMATISQDSSVFTITPKTVTEVGAGVELTGSITFRASDGVNILPSVSSFTLSFIFIIQNSKYTTLLVTAVDTSDNNTIVDSSSNNETITVYGNPSAGTFSPYRHGGYSTYFDGSGDYLTVPYDASIAEWYTSDYTIEAWVYYNSFNVGSASGSPLIVRHGNATTASNYWSLGAISTGELQFYYYNGSPVTTCISTATLNLNQWHHIVMSHNNTNNEITLYLDGVSVHTHTISGTPQVSSSHTITIGQLYNTSHNGYITDLRITASEVYTTAFTPPTAHLTAITNTQLLACHLPYIADESTNNHSITRTGDVSTRPFTPFDNLEYASTDHGGSVYFDQGSNLTLADNDNWDLTSSNFTIKFWVYMQQDTFPSGYIRWIDDAQTTTSTQGNWALGIQSNKQVRLTIWDSSKTLLNVNSGTSKLIENHIWYYVEWSGGTVKVNGETYISYTHPNTGAIGGNMVIGSGQNHQGTREAYMKGYIADLHFVNGSTAAESSIPTAPMSSVSDTKLLIKGTDASIIDKSQNANLQLVGNTTGSTTQTKFADTKSMYFDGTGDYIKTSASTDYDLPTDFTIEAWIYPTALSSNSLIVDTYNASQAGSYQLYWRSTGGSLAFYTQADGVLLQDPSGSNIQVNTWHHVAVSRSGNTIRMFVDGTQVNSTTLTRDLTHGIPVAIGYQQATGTNYFAGYIQDVRITKGLARYTANFTPPTESFKG